MTQRQVEVLSRRITGSTTGFQVLNVYIQLFRETLSEKSTKLHKPIPKSSMDIRIELLHVLNTNEITK